MTFDHFYMHIRDESANGARARARELRAQRNSVEKEFMLIYFCFVAYLWELQPFRKSLLVSMRIECLNRWTTVST